MGGHDVLTVCHAGLPLAGCTLGESALCHRFAESFVRCCAGVIMGVKPLALFSYRFCGACRRDACASRRACAAVFSAYARALGAHGIKLVPLFMSGERAMLIAWREDLVSEMLGDDDNRAFLTETGFDASDAPVFMVQVRRRLMNFYRSQSRALAARFPHELGLVFGYPLEDVIGFMRGGQATCCGAWKAYGDKRIAQERFARVAAFEEQCRCRYRSGMPLGELLACSP